MTLFSRLRRLSIQFIWLAPVAFVVLVFAAERLLSSGNDRFALLPATGWITDWLRPGIRDLDQAIIGFLLMALAAGVFAWSIRKKLFREPEADTSTAAPASSLHIPKLSLRVVSALGGAALLWLYLLLRLIDKEHHWLHPALLLVAVAIPMVLLLRYDLTRGVSFRFNIERWELVSLAALVSAAGLILTFDLAGTPDSMVGDEGAFWLTAKSLARHEQSIDFFAPGVSGFPLASSIFQAIFVKAFGESLWSWRLSVAVAVLAAMIPLYFLVRAMFDRRMAFAALALMATSPFLIAFARIGYINSQALFPLVVALLLIYLAVERKSATLFFAAGVVAGVGFYTYFGARVSVFIIAAFLVHAWLTRRLTFREAALGLTLAAIGTIMVGILPTVRLFAEGRESLQTKLYEGIFANVIYVRAKFPDVAVDSFPSIRVANVDLFFDGETWLRIWGRGWLRTILAFHRTDLIEKHYISGSLGGTWISALLLPGVAVAVRRIREPGPALLLAWTVVTLVLFGMFGAFPPQQTHLIVIIPAVAILYALALSVVANSLARFARAKRNVVVTGLVAIAVIFFGVLGTREYFYNANRTFGPTLDIALWFEAKDLAPNQKVAFVYTNDLYDGYVPWGVKAFDLESRYFSVRAADLQDPTMLARLRGAEVVMVDGLEPQATLDAVATALPERHISSRDNRAGDPVVWYLRRPP